MIRYLTVFIGQVAYGNVPYLGLGEDKLRIGTVDADGVVMAAIKGLNEKLNDKEKRIVQLEKRNEDKNQKIAEMKKTVTELQRKNAGVEAR